MIKTQSLNLPSKSSSTHATVKKQGRTQPRLSLPPVIQLQKNLGNQAMLRLLHSGAIQARLAISQPNDLYEQEANQVAQQVMRMPEPRIPREERIQTKSWSEPTPVIQRREEEEEPLQAKEMLGYMPKVTPEVEIHFNAMRGSGQPLPESVRTFFEPRFGYDFSQIPLYPTARTRIQPKLAVSTPGDIYEQEAGRVADAVVAGYIPPIGHVSQGVQPKLYRVVMRPEDMADNIYPPWEETEAGPSEASASEEVQRSATGEAGAVGPHFEQSLLQAVHRGGEALPAPTQSLMESRFGWDFSSVRVHSDAQADALARGVSARAFTLGQDIFFARSQYQPERLEGQRLLAHELTHTLQWGAASRLARACEANLEAIPIPESDSTLTGHAFVNLATVQITSDIAVSPLAGNFHVKIRVPRELQQTLMGSGALGRFLGGMRLTADISATIRSEESAVLATQYAGNELCVFVTFRREAGGEESSQEWYADLRIVRGGGFVAPLRIGAGAPMSAAPPSPLGTGVARIQLRLTEDLTASTGPFRISDQGSITAIWEQIRDQIRDALAIRIQNIQVPLDLRARASLTVPVPLPGGEEAASSVIPVDVLGDIRLSTQVSTETGGYTLRLSGAASGTAAAGLVALELSGRGRLTGPLPSSVRLGDLSGEFLENLLRTSEGGGEIHGRLSAFGLPGRVDADFRLRESQVLGNATFVSPVGLGGGVFNYSLSQGLSADLGMVGLTHLTLAPAEDRLAAERRAGIGPPSYELGTSVTGLGVTGVRLTPSTLQILSVGVGPQFIRTPTGERQTGIYSGLQYEIQF